MQKETKLTSKEIKQFNHALECFLNTVQKKRTKDLCTFKNKELDSFSIEELKKILSDLEEGYIIPSFNIEYIIDNLGKNNELYNSMSAKVRKELKNCQNYINSGTIMNGYIDFRVLMSNNKDLLDIILSIISQYVVFDKQSKDRSSLCIDYINELIKSKSSIMSSGKPKPSIYEYSEDRENSSSIGSSGKPKPSIYEYSEDKGKYFSDKEISDYFSDEDSKINNKVPLLSKNFFGRGTGKK